MSPSLEINLFTAEHAADPFEDYDRVRAVGPVVYNTRDRFWMVVSDAAYREMAVNPERFSVEDTASAEVFGRESFIVIDDRAEHDARRGVWASDFRRSDLKRDMTETIVEVIEEAWSPVEERLLAGETVDVAAEFCRYPTLVIAAMLGVPAADRHLFADWSDLMGASFGVAPEDRETSPVARAGIAAGEEMGEYLHREIESRRREPGHDLITDMISSEVGKRLSDEAIIQNCRQLLFAGNETTTAWMKNTFVVFAQHPDARRQIVADRELLPPALEEVLRWHGLTGVAWRHAVGEQTLDGVEIPAGDLIIALLHGVNRDPEKYEEADVFDIHREFKMHAGFGYGLHSCLGINLGRLEAAIAVNRVLDVAPEWEIAADLDYGDSFNIRSPKAVEISLG
jgi:cytochrome P450